MNASAMFRPGALLLAAALTLAPGAVRAQQRITFDDAVRIAVARSADVARAESQVAAAELSVADAHARFLPSLKLSVGTSGSLATGLGSAESALNQSASAGLSAGMTLFDGLANVADLKAARLEAAAGASTRERARQSAVFDAVAGFLALVEAGEQAAVAADNLATEQKRESEVGVLVDAGSRPIADLYQQKATVAAARAALVSTQRDQENRRLDLIQSLRLDPSGSYDFVVPAASDPAEPPALELDALLGKAVAQRADLRAAGARAEAADQTVRAAGASRWPALSLSLGYGTNASNGVGGSLTTQLGQRQSASLGLSLSVPVFDGGAAGRAVERAEISVTNARLDEEELQRSIELDVRRSVVARQSAEAQVEAAQARVEAARQALSVTEQRYAAGASTLLEVAQTRSAFVDATSAALRARYELLYQDSVLRYQTGELAVPQDAT